MLLVPLANKGPAWSPHHTTGSDIHVQTSITFVLTAVCSSNKQLRRSSFMDRMVGYSSVII